MSDEPAKNGEISTRKLFLGVLASVGATIIGSMAVSSMNRSRDNAERLTVIEQQIPTKGELQTMQENRQSISEIKARDETFRGEGRRITEKDMDSQKRDLEKQIDDLKGRVQFLEQQLMMKQGSKGD